MAGVASLAADAVSPVAMAVHARLLLILCLLGAGRGMAQSLPPPLNTTTVAAPQPTPIRRTMSTVIAVSIVVFFFLLLLCVYIRQHHVAQNGVPPGGPVAAAAGGGPFRMGKRGLDPEVVATFPIVPYREIKEHKIGRRVLECAVCLTELEESDDLRLLPYCSHAFHPECIDPWLEARVTCPLCRANLEKPAPAPAPAPVAPPSPEQVTPRQPSPSASPPHAVAIPVQGEGQDSDEEDRQEEAIELEMLRSKRRAARLPKDHSTGHSLFAASAAAAARDDHERFTLRLPQHVREEVLRSRRLRHATSLTDLSGICPEGSSRGGRSGVGNDNGGRRWQSFLSRTMSWARVGGDGSVRKRLGGSTRRGRDDARSSRKGAVSPAAGRP